MSLPLLIKFIDEACKSGSITIDTKNYLLKKAVEFDISTEMVEKMLSAKKINIIESKQTPHSTESVFSSINATLRKTFADYLSKGSYDTIIDYFEDKLLGTLDYVLTDAYLKALLGKEEYKKAFIQSEKLKENIKSDLKKIYPTLGQIYLNAKKHDKAFDIFYSLLADDEPDTQENLDLLINNVFNDGEFDLLDKCRKSKNYLNIAKGKLLEFYESEKYLYYIKLFEADFYKDDAFVEKYIWSLFICNGYEKKAYEKGKFYLTKNSNTDSLNYVMGLVCISFNKWLEAYDFLKNCFLIDIDVQNNIDEIIDKLIENKDWTNLKHFKESKNYTSKIATAFSDFSINLDHTSVIQLFEQLIISPYDNNQIEEYIYSLIETDVKKASKKYKEFDSYFTNVDKYWIKLGGEIYEKNNEHEKALELYIKAESIESGYCSKDIKRINYLLNPEIYFKDLYTAKEYSDAIKIFESKLKKTTDINVIKSYINSLYKNDGTEEKGLELGIIYYKSHPKGEKLLLTIAAICKYLEKYSQAKDYLLIAKSAGYNIDVELQEINMAIAKVDEDERRRKEEIKRKKIEEELIREEEIEEERKATQKRKIEREQGSIENKKIGTHRFTNDWKRGGNVLLQEHITLNDDEVTWSKKKNIIWGSDSKSIPINKVTQIDLDTSLVGTDITIRGKGFGYIKGSNFSKSDAKKIKSLIEKAQ
jgi:hypothetical protein